MIAVDMSPAGIEARLQAVSDLSPLDFRPLPRVDMSPAAVEARLIDCARLWRFCVELATPAPHRNADAAAPPLAGGSRRA